MIGWLLALICFGPVVFLFCVVLLEVVDQHGVGWYSVLFALFQLAVLALVFVFVIAVLT